MLFADGNNEAWGYVALGTFISAIITALVAGVVKLMNARHQNSSEIRVWSVTEAQKVIDRQYESISKLEARVASLETAVDEAREAHGDCLRNNTILTKWIEWAQPELDRAGIRVPKFDLDDSRTHLALQTPPPQDRRPPQ